MFKALASPKFVCSNRKQINPFPNKPFFTCLQYKSFENIAGKGEIAHKEQFLQFPQCFLAS